MKASRESHRSTTLQPVSGMTPFHAPRINQSLDKKGFSVSMAGSFRYFENFEPSGTLCIKTIQKNRR
jgi:hypothetical protein